MIPLNTNNRILELYSSKRDRNLYPNPSAFEVNFAPTIQNHCGEKIIHDPVCKGAIYYTFDWTPQIEATSFYDQVSLYNGIAQEGSTSSILILKLSAESQTDYVNPSNPANFPNFFVGFKIYSTDRITKDSIEYRYITSWDPSTNIVTVNRPFTDPVQVNDFFPIFSILPQTWRIVIPTLDSNFMVVNKTSLYYNGYYVVFESPNPNYSNSTNSNIFSRRISYYDSNTQIAYFEEPLPFNYLDNPPTENQRWTLRKDLPLERWTLSKETYYKNTKPINPLIGPLQGYVVILPDGASSIDNYYKGKYIYAISNGAEVYSPPLPPQNDIQPISGAFYPIYGLFYIRAYNGTTKEASIEPIVNKMNVSDKYNITNDSEIPTALTYDINAGDFIPVENCAEIQDMGGGVYRPIYDILVPPIDPVTNFYRYRIGLLLKRGKTYNISMSVRVSQTLKDVIDSNTTYSVYFTSGSQNTGQPTFYSEDLSVLSTEFQTYNFTITVAADTDLLKFGFLFLQPDPLLLPESWFEIKDLQVTQISIINIVELNYDNFSPLDYNGTMVSANEVVCYEMQIVSVTLPNRGLLTGSIIAFYPFVYVQIENVTSPSRMSGNIIISNNPPSTKAVFTVYVPQVNNPNEQRFVTLLGGDRQIVKFKPNDNLRFSVYLPDGTPFQTLLPDTLSPYPPDPSLQVHAVFSLSRISV